MKLKINFKFCSLIAMSIVPFLTNAQGFSWAQGFAAIGGVPVSSSVVVNTTCDISNNIYSIGGFTGTVDFDKSSTTYNITSANPGSFFILKEDAAGNFLWAKAFHRKSNVAFSIHGRSLSLDTDGNIYIAGTFTDTVDFDPGPGTYYMTPPMSSVASNNAFIVKLNPNGDFIWAKQIGGGAGSSL